MIEKKKIVNLLVALVVVSAFVLSAIVKTNFYGYGPLIKWLLILTLLIASISLTGNSWKKKWSKYDWIEWASYLFIDIFLILLVLGKANIYWRIAALAFIFVDLTLPAEHKRQNRVKEIKKEAKILKSAEKKFESYLNKKRTEKKGKFFGSKKGKIVHKTGCPIGEKIKIQDRVYFSSLNEAHRKGYRNCKVCFKHK